MSTLKCNDLEAENEQLTSDNQQLEQDLKVQALVIVIINMKSFRSKAC